MKHASRLALLAWAAVAALVFAGSALATPRLIIGGLTALGSSQVTVQFTEDKTDAAPTKISIYVPTGYTGAVTAAAGTQIGTVHADLQALAISPDAIINADGQILTADPSRFVANTCTPGTHTAVWLLHVTVSGQTLDVPMYVDLPAPTNDPLVGTSSARLVVCFSSPYVPTPVGAPFGAKIINAALTLNQGTFTTPTARGAYLWRAVVTPYTVGSATPNAAGTVETRGVVEAPSALTISAKVTNKKKRIVRISGVLKTGDAAIQGATVNLSGSIKAKKKTNAAGAVVFTTRFKKKGTYRFQLKTSVSAFDMTSQGCSQPTPTLQCVSATHNGFTAQSPVVRVRVR